MKQKMNNKFCKICNQQEKLNILVFCVQNFTKIAWMIMDYDFKNKNLPNYTQYHKRNPNEALGTCEIEQ